MGGAAPAVDAAATSGSAPATARSIRRAGPTTTATRRWSSHRPSSSSSTLPRAPGRRTTRPTSTCPWRPRCWPTARCCWPASPRIVYLLDGAHLGGIGDRGGQPRRRLRWGHRRRQCRRRTPRVPPLRERDRRRHRYGFAGVGPCALEHRQRWRSSDRGGGLVWTVSQNGSLDGLDISTGARCASRPRSGPRQPLHHAERRRRPPPAPSSDHVVASAHRRTAPRQVPGRPRLRARSRPNHRPAHLGVGALAGSVAAPSPASSSEA